MKRIAIWLTVIAVMASAGSLRVDFLDSDPLARDLWCGSRRQLVESVAPDGLVAEVNDRLANPCP